MYTCAAKILATSSVIDVRGQEYGLGLSQAAVNGSKPLTATLIITHLEEGDDEVVFLSRSDIFSDIVYHVEGLRYLSRLHQDRH